MQDLFDAELRLMEIVWEHEPVSAKEISLLAAQKLGWNKNTTYTVINRLIKKEVLRREEPGFVCTSLVKKSEVQKAKTKMLIDKLFDGSKKAFFSAFADETLSQEEVEALKALIEKRE